MYIKMEQSKQDHRGYNKEKWKEKRADGRRHDDWEW